MLLVRFENLILDLEKVADVWFPQNDLSGDHFTVRYLGQASNEVRQRVNGANNTKKMAEILKGLEWNPTFKKE